MTATWQPFPGAQWEFCQRSEFEALFGGASGGGKTDCLIALAAERIDHPRYRALLLRRTFPELQEIIDRCWYMYPGFGGQYRAGNHRWYFPSGAYVELGHMQHEDDRFRYHGRQFHFVGFDELTRFHETQYTYIFSRLRSAEDDLDIYVRATTNPGGPGHTWVKERFVTSARPGMAHCDPATGLSRIFIPSTVQDNPALMVNDPGYIARLEALPEIERKRYLHGDWESFEGQVFGELSMRVHGCEAFDIPPEWERFMVLDWGYAKPFSVDWWAVDYDGVLYRYREWYGCQEGMANTGLRMVAEDVAKEILDIEERAGERKIGRRIADPSIFHKRPRFRAGESRGLTIADDFQAQGLFFLKADNDRVQGLQQVHKRFKLEPEVDESTGEVIAEHPRIQIFNDHRHFWRTMPLIQESASNPDDVDTDQEDHIFDCVRYACQFKPILPKRRRPGPPPNSFQAERARLIRARKYAASHGVSLSVAYTRIR